MKDLCYNWKKTNRAKRGNLTFRLKSKIQNFYERDDNSRATAGIKETIIRGKIKKQNRTLTNTIEKLFEKFCFENTNTQVSYTTFCRLKLFWVVIPKENDGRLVHVSSMKIYSFRLCTKKKSSKQKIFTHWSICFPVTSKALPVCMVSVLNAEKSFLHPR